MNKRSSHHSNREPSPADPINLATRRIISLVLIGYLVVLLLGPLSNPVGSEHLARPLAKRVSPIHRALFLGHGYRFFAPNPGPSHLVDYRITKQDGSEISGRFPNRNDDAIAFPRLQYHRWFMLSETIYNEHNVTPIQAEFEADQKRLELLATEKQIAGQRQTASRIRQERERRGVEYAATRKRIDELMRSVARGVLEMHGGGSRIQLYARERTIPHPIDVSEGARLDEERFFLRTDPPLIGDFSAVELGLGLPTSAKEATESTSPPADRTLEPEDIETETKHVESNSAIDVARGAGR